MLFAAEAEAVTRETVSLMLRRTLPNTMVAAVIVTIGLTTIALYWLARRTRRDRALLSFGVFAVLYGVRALADTEPVSLAVGLPEIFWRYLIAVITYAISLPILFLLIDIFPGWRKVLRGAAWFMGAFALLGLASDLLTRRPFSLTRANSALTLLALIAFLVALFRESRRSADVSALRAGLLIFSATIVFENSKELFAWRPALNLEPFGLLAFLVSFGRVLARRINQNSERLVELDKELEIARRIQKSILPREMPTGSNWDIAALYLPMTAVAGDFYEFLHIDDKRLGILIADVSGHGVPAALIASMVKVAIAGQRANAASPARVLSGMNATLSGHLQGQYVTAAYLYLDLETQKARYAAAAHPPLFCQHADSTIEAIEENGLMLGLFAQAPYTERELDLQPGDRFLLYTDGLTEAANHANEFYGDEQAKLMLAQTKRQTAADAVKQLGESVARWCPVAQDDLTIVLLAAS